MPKQIGFIKNIVELKEIHPDHEIHFLTGVHNWDSDYAWVTGEIVSVKLGKWLQLDDRIFLDEDEVKEHYVDYLMDTKEHAQEAVDKMSPAILVRIAG